METLFTVSHTVAPDAAVHLIREGAVPKAAAGEWAVGCGAAAAPEERFATSPSAGPVGGVPSRGSEFASGSRAPGVPQRLTPPSPKDLPLREGGRAQVHTSRPPAGSPRDGTCGRCVREGAPEL